MLPDIVVPCRPGENDELRYALRSMANVPHREVWSAGDVPAWCRTQHLPVVNDRRKLMSRWVKHQSLLGVGEADEVIYWDDDMFAMRPVDRVWPMHRGELRLHVEQLMAKDSSGPFARGLADTLALLMPGHPEPLSYFHHFPRVVNRDAALEVFDMLNRTDWPVERLARVDWYTIYANHFHLGGVHIVDCKITTDNPGPFDGYGFLSTSDQSFAAAPVGAYIRSQLTERSVYEA